MFRGLFEGPGIWIVLVVVLLLFGATRLPALARSIGQSTKILRDEMKKPGDESVDSPPSNTAQPGETAARSTPDSSPTTPARAGQSDDSPKS